MPQGTQEQEDEEEGEKETLTSQEQQNADILANLDDIVIPTMDTDACADIAEDEPSVEQCKVEYSTILIINVMRITKFSG